MQYFKIQSACGDCFVSLIASALGVHNTLQKQIQSLVGCFGATLDAGQRVQNSLDDYHLMITLDNHADLGQTLCWICCLEIASKPTTFVPHQSAGRHEGVWGQVWCQQTL